MKVETAETASAREKIVFTLFACCIPVRGARRSVICDLQRHTFRFIPNGLYEILTEHRGKEISSIKSIYGHEFDEEIDEYFAFLCEQEFGFWCDEPENFPDLELAWDGPERITNAIIDVDHGSDHDYHRLLNELDDLGCKALELRFFRPAGLAELRRVLNETRFGRLRSIALVVGWSDELTPEDLKQLTSDHPRIESVIIHSAPESRHVNDEKTGVILIYRREVIGSPGCCGQVHVGYFVTNIETFTEAQRHNTCLNRKISVDSKGEIKNCPSLPRSFGNAKQISLHSALAHRDFPQLWLINKDQVDVCKECEFRYICTDCRAYLADPSNLYSKPAKCNYDPHTAQWTSDSGE